MIDLLLRIQYHHYSSTLYTKKTKSKVIKYHLQITISERITSSKYHWALKLDVTSFLKKN